MMLRPADLCMCIHHTQASVLPTIDVQLILTCPYVRQLILDPSLAETLPAAKGPGNVYVMRIVLHDWSDEKSLEILKNMRTAIGEFTLSKGWMH